MLRFFPRNSFGSCHQAIFREEDRGKGGEGGGVKGHEVSWREGERGGEGGGERGGEEKGGGGVGGGGGGGEGNVAPGSIDNFPTTTSPEILAAAFTVNVLLTINFPDIFPSTSALEASMLPFTKPSTPMITLPLVIKLPSKVPSMRKSPSDFISPVMNVFFAITFLSIIIKLGLFLESFLFSKRKQLFVQFF